LGLDSNASAQEVPVLVNTIATAKAMMIIDDSNSMECVLEHTAFSPTSAVATNSANTIPSVIFKLESGAAAAATTHTLRPMLIEYNYLFENVLTSTRGQVTGNIFEATTLANVANMDLLISMGCTTSSNYCNAPSDTNQYGIHNAVLYSNSSIRGSAVFATANLAKTGSTTITDTAGNEYLYMNYYSNLFPQNMNWTTYWPKFDASHNQVSYATRVWSTKGGTLKFNGKEVFLSAGLYRLEYLRWLFYGATNAQLAALPGATRLETVKTVMVHLVNNNPQVKFGIASLNGSNYTPGSFTGYISDEFFVPHGDATAGAPKIRANVGTVSASLISSINTIAGVGGTPLSNTYIETLRYMHGEASNDPGKPNFTYTSPISSECDAHFVVLLTDGLPTSDSANSFNGAWINDSDGDHQEGVATNQSCASATCSLFLDDAAKIAYETDFKTDLVGTQNITSYAVGLGLDYNLLSRFAAHGGSGNALRADSAEEISAALQEIVAMIVTTPVAGAGAALAETFGDNGRVYRPRFKATSWYGEIDAYQYNSETEALEKDFEFGKILSLRDLDASPRNIIVGYDSDSDGNTNSTLEFTTANAATLRPKLFKRFIDGVEDPTLLADPLLTYTADATATALITFIQGTDATDLRERDEDGDGHPNRLGDIVYSRPVEVGPKNGQYNSMLGYTDFTSSLQSEPRLLLVGANDGMLHAFNATTGEELWAYIPSSVVPYLEMLARPFYNRLYRRSYVDGLIDVEDVFISGHWRTYAMFGLRTGGSTYTVLDITDRANPTLVYEVSNPADYGESWTKPRAILYNNSTNSSNPDDYTWAMVVGTGEAKATVGTKLLVYPLEVSSPPSPTSVTLSASDPIGTRTSGVTPVNDDRDFNVDRLYVGTEEGDLYRVHVSGSAATWVVQKLYDGANTNPIVATPAVALVDNPTYSNVASSGPNSQKYAVGVYWGTGRYDVRNDVGTLGLISQKILGIFDPVDVSSDTYAAVRTNLTTTNLQNQTVATFATRRDSDGIYRVPVGKAGFYVNLDTSINLASDNFINPVGMVFYEPANVRGALLFSTFLPSQDQCDVGGHAFLEGMNFRTGGGLIVDNITVPGHPFYNGGIPDVNNDGSIDSDDLTTAVSSSLLEAVLDSHVESVSTDETTPYVLSGTLAQNDIRLATTGAILPSVSSLGNLGAPLSPAVLYSAQKIIIQPAYPVPPETGSPGIDGSGIPQVPDSQIDPPVMLPINTYNLPIEVLTFKEVSQD